MSVDATNENHSQGDESDASELALGDSETRRDLLKKAGAVGGAGLVSGLAGCTGGLGGDGESDGGSDGGSSSTKTVKLLMAPSGFMGIAMDYLFRDTDKLYEYYEEEGLDVELSKSWEGAAVFTAGGADYETFGSLEAAMIAAEREIPLTVNANLVPMFILIITGAGSDYDPEVAGSQQASIDALVEDQATFALGGWGGATATAIVLAMDAGFGYTFVDDPEESDFRVTTAEWFAIPQLITRGDAAAGTNSPEHGMAPYAGVGGAEPEVTTIYQIGKVMEEAGLGIPQMNGWTCSQEFTDNYPGSSPALVKAYHEGMEWLYEDPVARIAEDEDHHLEQLGAENMEQAEWMIQWGISMELDNELPMYYQDVELTDEFIETDKGFLAEAEASGYLSSGWQDRLEYRQVSQT